MNLPIIRSHNTNLKEFIEYWGNYYTYAKENLYEDCIYKPFYNKDDIESLYEWKNSMKLSKLKKNHWMTRSFQD